MAHDREVGGIRCLQVLALLSDYLDGDVGAADRQRIEEHLLGCDWCERFGGRFSGIVAALRRELGAPAAVDPAIAKRLADRLDLPT